MQCKIFTVPLDSEGAMAKERNLNEFLAATEVKRVFASIANQPQGPVWSILFMYDEGAQKVQTLPAAQPMRTTQAAQAAHAVQPMPTAQQSTASAGAPVDAGPVLTAEQVKWIVALKRWRADQAAAEGVPLYMVAQNKWLEDIVRMPARNLDDLMNVRGLGEWRVQKYGTKILEALTAANAARRSWGSSSSYSAGRA
jgi:superfamily II DNA helicase RecQ